MQYPNLLINKLRHSMHNNAVRTGRERKRQLLRLFSLFAIITALHTAAMMHFEQLSIKDALWLTLSTITTVGYGDLAAQSDLGRLSTTILLFFGGITLLAQLAAEYIDFRFDRRDRQIKGYWEWKNMKDHIVIINVPVHDTERYLTRLIHQFRSTPTLAARPIQIVTDQFTDGLPLELRDMNVSHYHARAEAVGSLDKVNVDKAKYVLIIARNYTDAISDSISFDILDRIKTTKTSGYIVCEIVDDENRKRFIDSGANSVIRPIRAYPEIVTRAFDSPGTEKVLENLFSHKGDHPHRYDIKISNTPWSELAYQIINSNLGTPLGYINENNQVMTNPKADTNVNAKALIILVHESSIPSSKELARAISG